MLPFMNEEEMKLFENSKYYFIQNNEKIKYLKTNKFQYDFNILKNFHEYLQECKFVKWSNELHNEDAWKIHEDALKRNFNYNWKIEKNGKFHITYDKNEIFINSKNNNIDYLKYFDK